MKPPAREHRSSAGRARRLAVVGAVWGTLLLGVGQLLLWIRVFLDHPLDQDFTLWYAAARIGLDDGWAHLYDLDRQQLLIRQLQHIQVISPLSVYISPPPLAWLAVPFTLLPPVPAYLLWTGLSIAALWAGWRLSAPAVERRWLYALPLMAWFPVFAGLVLGQPVAFVIFAIALAVWLAGRGRAFAGGLVLSVALLKPQLALLVGPALLVGGELGLGLGWLTGSAILVALSIGLVGIPGLERGLELVRGVQVYPYNSYLTLGYLVDPLVRSGYLSPTTRLAGLNPLTLGLQAAVALATLAIAYHHRGHGPRALVPIGLIGSILVAPHLHQDDLAVLVLAAWLLAGSNQGRLLRLWPLVVLAAGEAPQLITPVPLLLSLLVWLLLLWKPAEPSRREPSALPSLLPPVEEPAARPGHSALAGDEVHSGRRTSRRRGAVGHNRKTKLPSRAGLGAYSSSIWLNIRLSWMSYRTSIASGTVATLRAPRISAARVSTMSSSTATWSRSGILAWSARFNISSSLSSWSM
jgi:hypothetical protein